MPIEFRNERDDEYRASIYLTRRCDVRCWYCQVPLVDAKKRSELGASGWRNVVDRMAEMGVTLAVNTGGEPFLRQELLLDTIPYQIERGVYPVLLTNGRLLYKSEGARETLRKLVDSGLNALSVSIDRPSDAFDHAEGSVSKSATGKWALDFAAGLGMTDLSLTAVLDDADPQATIELLEWNAGRYNVLIQLVTRDIGGSFSNARAGEPNVRREKTTRRHVAGDPGEPQAVERAERSGILPGRHRQRASQLVLLAARPCGRRAHRSRPALQRRVRI